MMGEAISCVAGILLGFFLTALVVSEFDRNYNMVVWEVQRTKALCEALGTTPKSYDSQVVTCEDGTEIYYRKGTK